MGLLESSPQHLAYIPSKFMWNIYKINYAWAIEQISTNLKKQCQTKHPPNAMQLKISFKRQLLKSVL